MDLVEVKQQYEDIKEHYQDMLRFLDIDVINDEITRLQSVMEKADFWNNLREAKKIIDKSNGLKDKVARLEGINNQLEDIKAGFELIADSEDESLVNELGNLIKKLKKEVSEFEIEIMLSGTYDKNNAILEIHPGAGGTESQDWGEMLLRMYTRYAEKQNFKVEVIDYLPGEEAGIKSVTLLIKGNNAYGYLKAEKGVHRLIRISPFDASGRRHTSFASVEVMPEITDEIEVEIRTEDLKVDTFRSSGAGGQHVNKTESAIRITHLPTGIVVSCQQDRSQIQNREIAMRMLKTKLYQLEQQKQIEELETIRGEVKENGWGSQIRSYVFHPYSLVKDHRTNAEMGNIQAVMDGELAYFINEYLRFQIRL